MTTVVQPPFKLGKAARMDDPRNLKLAKFVNLSQLPSPPEDSDFSDNVSTAGFPMFANDRYGDCTCATAGHMVQVWTALGGGEETPTEQDVIGMYAAVTGFDPSTGRNDNGAVELDVLNWWRKNPIANERILAHVEVDPHNYEELQVAHWLFGGLYLGFALPQAWQGQVGPGKSWDAPSGKAEGIWTPGTWGGHAINTARARFAKGEAWVVTWAMLQHVAADAFPVYCDEAHAILCEHWQEHFPEEAKRGGFDWDKLQAALGSLGTLNQ